MSVSRWRAAPVTHLTLPLGQPVGPHDPSQVAVLEDRARPCGDVGQDAGEPGPTRGASARRQLLGQSLRGGPSTLHHVGQHPERLEVGIGTAGHLDGGVVVPQTWWADRPHRPLLEPVDPPDAYAGRREHRPRPGHGHLDRGGIPSLARALVGAQGRLPRERGRPGVQHRRPGALDPGRVPRVVHVDARGAGPRARDAGSDAGCSPGSPRRRAAGPGTRRRAGRRGSRPRTSRRATGAGTSPDVCSRRGTGSVLGVRACGQPSVWDRCHQVAPKPHPGALSRRREPAGAGRARRRPACRARHPARHRRGPARTGGPPTRRRPGCGGRRGPDRRRRGGAGRRT